MAGEGAGVTEGVQSGVGAAYGEIPLFEPGTGSAASAGMTEVGVRLRLWGARRIWGRLLVPGLAAPTVNDV